MLGSKFAASLVVNLVAVHGTATSWATSPSPTIGLPALSGGSGGPPSLHRRGQKERAKAFRRPNELQAQEQRSQQAAPGEGPSASEIPPARTHEALEIASPPFRNPPQSHAETAARASSSSPGDFDAEMTHRLQESLHIESLSPPSANRDLSRAQERRPLNLKGTHAHPHTDAA